MTIAEACATKCCSACKEELPLESFTVARQNPDGLKRECRGCSNARRKQWGKQNPDKAAALRAKYAEKHIDEHRARAAQWRLKNPDKVQLSWDEWHKKNPAARREAANAWVRKNKPYGAYRTAVRRAQKLQATPQWCDAEFEQFAISEAYRLSALRSTITGVRHHVDHIVPLLGKTVCGLHCSANLQVIPAFVNQSKNNRHWPQMP